MKSEGDAAVFVLAGGQSSRMGGDKAFLVFRGQTLLDRALAVAREVSPQVAVVGLRAKFGEYGSVVEDVFAGCGPLGGIHAALTSEMALAANVMLAVDTPLVTAGLLRHMLARFEEEHPLVAVPRIGGRLHPLVAVYGKAFGEIAATALKAGKYRVDGLFPPGQTLEIGEDELKRFAFEAAMFENLNTPEEFERAQARKIP